MRKDTGAARIKEKEAIGCCISFKEKGGKVITLEIKESYF